MLCFTKLIQLSLAKVEGYEVIRLISYCGNISHIVERYPALNEEYQLIHLIVDLPRYFLKSMNPKV